MGYPKQFDAKAQEILRHLVPIVEAIEPGKRAIIEHKDPETLALWKYFIYAWLSPLHSNKKELFRIKQLSTREFMVCRYDDSPATITMQGGECEAFVCEHLIECEDTDEAIAIIQANCTDAQLQMRIFTEWQKKLGAGA